MSVSVNQNLATLMRVIEDAQDKMPEGEYLAAMNALGALHRRRDGLAQRERGVVGVAEVADGGEAGEERLLRVERGAQGPVARVHEKALGVALRRALPVEVHVHVHQAGHHGRGFEVDNHVARLCVFRNILGNQVGPGIVNNTIRIQVAFIENVAQDNIVNRAL